MKIKLQQPFSEIYSAGYLRTSKDGRKRVDLYNSKTDRTTVSYARYIVSVREGRFLCDNEEVDHDDGNPSNDESSNLILRNKEEHLKKTLSERKPANILSFKCPVCGKTFHRRKGLEGRSRSPKCSRTCNGKASRAKQLSAKS